MAGRQAVWKVKAADRIRPAKHMEPFMKFLLRLFAKIALLPVSGGLLANRQHYQEASAPPGLEDFEPHPAVGVQGEPSQLCPGMVH
jgi:hypothetical protein